MSASPPCSTGLAPPCSAAPHSVADEEAASLWSRVTLSWLSRLLAIGHRRPITFSDIGPLPSRYRSPRLPAARAHNDTLERRLVRFACSRGFYQCMLLMLIADVSTYATPVLQAALLSLIEMRAGGAVLTTEDYRRGALICLGMFALQCLNTLAINVYFKRAMAIGMEVRAAVQCEVYERLLQMDDAQPGQLLNLATTDAARLDLVVPFINYWWSNPMQCLLVAVLLYRYVRLAGLVGVAILIVLVPLQNLGASAMARSRRSAAHRADCRLRLFQEVLAGIRTVKLKSWEGIFLDDLDSIRVDEQGDLMVAQYIRATTGMFSVTLPLLAFLITMVVYHVVLGYPISQSVTATVIAYFALLRQPLSLMPMVTAATSDARAALHRLSAFLATSNPVDGEQATDPAASDTVVAMHGCVFQHKHSPANLAVDNVQVKQGELVVVTGPVGSGKTSLLMAILGELPMLKGRLVRPPSSVAYSAQRPWILNRTVRENIVFVSEYRAQVYEQVVEMCQLGEDLDRLPEGDATMIGERGANLSGGQKSRISMARALYHALCSSAPGVLLLDDPLASVDARVSRVLGGSIVDMQGVTRIVVSSHPHLLRRADRVLLVDSRGQVSMSTAGMDYATAPSPPPSTASGSPSPPAPRLVRAKAAFVDQRRDTAIQGRVFADYLSMAGGLYFVLPALLFAALQQGTRTMSDVTANQWASVHRSANAASSAWYITVFSGYVAAHGIAFFMTGSFFITRGQRAARALHSGAVRCILGAPLTWIIQQSPGRLTNRLSADMETVDYVLPESLRTSLVVFANVAATLVLLVVHKWYNVLPIGVIVGGLLLALQYYRSSSREMGRLTAVAKGPLQGHLVETASGLTSIRAFQAQSEFRGRCQRLVDECNRPYFVQVSLQRWLELRVTMAGNVLILLAALSTLFVPGPLALTTATMTKTLTVTRVLNWMIRRMADAELQFISVERLVSLAHESTMEGGGTEGGHVSLPASNKGMFVEFRNVSARYTQEDDDGEDEDVTTRALHNVSFTVLPGERVGIVGRTGSGKSTLILSLFRAVRPLPHSLILLDGQDTATMGLAELRQLIAVIPQDTFLFTATVRRNCDPGGKFTDDAIWGALDAAGLKDTVSALPLGLDHPLSPGDLSAGHSQLLAVARVVLYRPRLLVMDEATASLDSQSEQSVLQVLDRALPDCTVLSVAHRIPAVIQCNRVLVLDAGRIVEEGRPEDLLRDPASRFSMLANASHQ